MSKFLISAGHGGGAPGNTQNNRVEADLMVALRNIVALKLRDRGHDVTTDGNRMENYSLAKAMAMFVTGRLAIELHTNASTDPSASGVEVISTAKHSELSRRIAQNIAKVLNTRTRRNNGWFDYEVFKREQGRTLGFVGKGGILIEVFFQSNKAELERYEATNWIVAQAIVDALLQ